MHPYMVYTWKFLVLFIFGLLLIIFFRWLAPKVGWVDNPNDTIKNHKKVTPYLGGAGIIGTLLAGLLFYQIDISSKKPYLELVGIMVLFIVGLLDDKWPLSIRLRLISQFGVAAMTLSIGHLIRPTGLLYLDYFISMFGIVFMINALNIMDIMDGLAAGVSSLIIGALGIFLYLNGGPVYYIWLATICVTALLAFLVFNFNPASIFMGDAGSTALGYIISILFIHSFNSTDYGSNKLAALIIILVPVFELFYVSILRLKKGKNPLKGSKDHFPLRIRFMGYSIRRTVLIVYLITSLSCIMGLIISRQHLPLAMLLVLTTLFLFTLLGLRLAKIDISTK